MSRDPYKRERSNLSGVGRGRRLVIPADGPGGRFPITAKGLEIVNKGETWLTVAVIDSTGGNSVIDVPPGSKDYVPVTIAQVFAAGTSVSANLVIHAIEDGD